MGRPSEVARRIHEQVSRMNSRASVSERQWAQVLQDEHWWGEDPKDCHLCGAGAHFKWAGNGYCRAHYDQALQAALVDSNALIGRYDRAKGHLNFGRNLIEQALPKGALKEAIDATKKEENEPRFVVAGPPQ